MQSHLLALLIAMQFLVGVSVHAEMDYFFAGIASKQSDILRDLRFSEIRLRTNSSQVELCGRKRFSNGGKDTFRWRFDRRQNRLFMAGKEAGTIDEQSGRFAVAYSIDLSGMGYTDIQLSWMHKEKTFLYDQIDFVGGSYRIENGSWLEEPSKDLTEHCGQ
jgi:hypothetical protein